MKVVNPVAFVAKKIKYGLMPFQGNTVEYPVLPSDNKYFPDEAEQINALKHLTNFGAGKVRWKSHRNGFFPAIYTFTAIEPEISIFGALETFYIKTDLTKKRITKSNQRRSIYDKKLKRWALDPRPKERKVFIRHVDYSFPLAYIPLSNHKSNQLLVFEYLWENSHQKVSYGELAKVIGKSKLRKGEVNKVNREIRDIIYKLRKSLFDQGLTAIRIVVHKGFILRAIRTPLFMPDVTIN